MKHRTLLAAEIERALVEAYKKHRDGNYANLGRVALTAAGTLAAGGHNFRNVLAVVEFYIVNQSSNIFRFANITRRPPVSRKCWVFQKHCVEDGLFIGDKFFRLVSLKDKDSD
jgi:hypothetical protein